MATPHKTVWIIGAGFCRCLDAPLLNELFKDRHAGQLQRAAKYMDLTEQTAEGMAEAIRVYQLGRRHDHWPHAERFMELVEHAHRKPHGKAFRDLADLASQASIVATDVSPEWVESFRRDVKRVLMLDVSEFMHDLDEGSERLLPYRKWARRLNQDHEIISFNYDAVLPMLAAETGTMTVLNPRLEGESVEEQARKAKNQNKAVVSCLHGNLALFPEGVDVDRGRWPILTKEDECILGLPGPDKMSMSTGVLLPLWERVHVVLKEANFVIFLGYRFPETDLYAQDVILEAFPGPPNQTINVVLGRGRTSKDDYYRVHQLLTSRHMGRAIQRTDIKALAEEYIGYTQWPVLSHLAYH